MQVWGLGGGAMSRGSGGCIAEGMLDKINVMLVGYINGNIWCMS